MQLFNEDEFVDRCTEILEKQRVRTTLDREWSEDELQDDIYDICVNVMTPKLLDSYKYRALKDRDLLKPHYMSEQILDEVGDVVELYNKEYNKHRNEKIFGIHWYDEAITRIIKKKLKENLVV